MNYTAHQDDIHSKLPQDIELFPINNRESISTVCSFCCVLAYLKTFQLWFYFICEHLNETMGSSSVVINKTRTPCLLPGPSGPSRWSISLRLGNNGDDNCEQTPGHAHRHDDPGYRPEPGSEVCAGLPAGDRKYIKKLRLTQINYLSVK